MRFLIDLFCGEYYNRTGPLHPGIR